MSPANNSFFTPPRRQAIPRPLIARTELEPIQVDSDSEPEPVVISKKTTTAKAGNKNKVVIVIDSDSENDNDETCTQSTDVDLVSTSSSATIRNEHNLGLGEHSAKISHYQLMDVDIPEDTTVVDTSPTVPVDYLHAKENVPKDTIVVDTSRLSILASENGVDTDDVDVDDDDAINLPPSMPSSARYATYNSPSTPSTPPPRNGRITKIGYPSYDIDTPNKTRRSSRFLPHIDISSATGSRLKRKHDDDETYSPRRNRCLRSKTSSPSTRKSRRNITQRSGSHAAEGSTLLGNSAEDVPELPEVSDRSAALFTGDLSESLPLEIRQRIAFYLPEDIDIVNLASAAKALQPIIANHSLWCELYKSTYDPLTIPSSITTRNEKVTYQAEAYMRRSEVSRSVTYFDGRPLTNVRRSQSTQEFISSLPTMQLRNGPLVLGYLRELIIESDAVKVRKSRGIEEVVGLNFQHIRSRLTHSEPLRRLDILGAVMSVPSNNKFWSLSKIMSSHRPESTVLVIQLCLTHFFLDPTIDNSNSYHQEIAGIPSSQAAAHADHCRQPVFMGKYKSYANVRWILSVVRFMRYHFLESGELAGCYTALEPQLRPQAWVGRLESGTKKLGTHWKGGYIWVQDGQFVNFRRDPYNAQIDEESDGLHELSIFHDETAFPSTAWPQQFETLISTDPFPPSNSPNPLNVAALRFPLLSFFGTGRDATRPGHLFGRIHGLPLQQGIPGFQRVSFIKFCYNRAEMNLEFVDTEQIWAYEGCVLPGGRIMVGRWMHVSLDGDVLDPVDRLSGPFIYWNVDDNRADPPIFPSEALKYKELLRNTGFIN